MRRFDSRKQMLQETAMFEQGLRSLHQEAWPALNMSTPDVESRLHRKFVDGIVDADLQQYLRLHARADDFSTTVQKARQYVEAHELAKQSGASPKKPAIRMASRDDRSPSHDRQTTRILDGLERILTTVVRSDDQSQISSRGRSREAKRGKKARVRVVGTSPQGKDIPPAILPAPSHQPVHNHRLPAAAQLNATAP